jgi:hypothetical protein
MSTKRLGRYRQSINDSNVNSMSQPSLNELASLYHENSRRPLLDWNKPLFGKRRTSLQKILANANKAIEKSAKFINKIKARDLACADRLKAIPENVTIRKEYIKCRKTNCSHDRHGQYYYAYWKDPESKKLKKKYIGDHVPRAYSG